MPPLCIMIKPSSSLCNMKCGYCFYNNVAENRAIKTYGIMDSETVGILLQKTFDYAEGYVSFVFQGGEPTLAGVDFFDYFIKTADCCNKKHIKINYMLQSNGYDIPAAMIDFIVKNGFLVGISLDGPAEIHNRFRRDTRGEGTFNRVFNTAKALKSKGAEVNILSVVTDYTARHTAGVYNFFKKNGFYYQQYIPQIPDFGEETGMLSVSGFSVFLKTLFDLWYDDLISGRYVSIRYFDNLLGMLNGNFPESCGMNGVCAKNIIIESDGAAYPCDFYVIDEYKLGNIRDDTFFSLSECITAERFIDESKKPDDKCLSCKWEFICRGGCRRYRQTCTQTEPGLNIFCGAYRDFFEYSYKKLAFLALRGTEKFLKRR